MTKDALRALQRQTAFLLVNAQCFHWTLQGMGMLRLRLDDRTRLHIWDSRFKAPGVSMIHDHLQWGLKSTIVSGQMTNLRYHEVTEEDVAKRHPQDAALHQPYMFATLKAGEGCYFKHEPRRILLKRGYNEEYWPGDSYEQAPAEVHESIPMDGTVTIMVKEPTEDGESARVFWPEGEQWGSAEPRAASHSEVTEMVGRALRVLREQIG